MNEALFELVPRFGPWVLMLATFLSCLALPVPTSLMMLAAGAFVASGDLALWSVAGGALVGAILGDQAGFQVGRRGGAPFVARLERSPARRAAIARARDELQRHSSSGVFLSRWLLSPAGPYVNFVAGAVGIGRRTFTLWAALGEAVWVAIYVGLGFAMADRIVLVAELAGNAVGAITAGALALLVGLGLWRTRHRGA